MTDRERVIIWMVGGWIAFVIQIVTGWGTRDFAAGWALGLTTLVVSQAIAHGRKSEKQS